MRLQTEGEVIWLWLDRPESANALDLTLWGALPRALEWVDRQPQIKVAILAGEGAHFCAGADLSLLEYLMKIGTASGCPAESRDAAHREIVRLQAAFTAIEKLRIPVIAAVHGACIGAGVDLIAACDLRYTTKDAQLSIKEVDMGIVPDVGTLQRLQHIVGWTVLNELAYSAESFSGERAHQVGLMAQVYDSRDELYAAVGERARQIAGKSAIAVRGIKRNLLYSRDRTVSDGLDYVAAWNASALFSEDTRRAIERVRKAR